jgi:hypothetical protein
VALGPSPLSEVCRGIAAFLATQLGASANAIRVLIGTPAQAAQVTVSGAHKLNLFFYRLEPAELDADPGGVRRVRFQCLVTPFAVSENSVSAGENDLRLLGEVLRIFHEHPVLPQVDAGGEPVRLQVVPLVLSLDDVNHIWSTQGSDTTYRPSAAYEMSLAPIVPSAPAIGAQRVGIIGTGVGRLVDGVAPATSPVEVDARTVPLTRVATDRNDWAPRICLIHAERYVDALAFAIGSTELENFTPQVWIAGDEDETVTLKWELWDRSAGWRELEAPTRTVTPHGPELGGALEPPAEPATIGLPFHGPDDPTAPQDPAEQPRQAVLYATRTFTRPRGGEVSVRSNPVLISFHHEAQP